MKKTLLALSIISIFAVNANAASKLPADDLKSIDDILNDSSEDNKQREEKAAQYAKEHPKPMTKNEARKAAEAKKSAEAKAKSEPAKASPQTQQNNTQKPAQAPVSPIVNGDTPEQVRSPDYVPKLLVPLAHKELSMNIVYKQKNIFEKKIDENDFLLTYSDQVPINVKDEPAIKEIVDGYNKGKVTALDTMTNEPDVLTGVDVQVVEGKETRKNKIETISYGYKYIIQIKEIDNKNNRIKYRLDYSRSNIKSYNEVDMILENGETKLVKIPQIEKIDASKEFYLPIKNGVTTNIRIDNSSSIDLTLVKATTLVDTIAIDNKKAIEEKRLAKIAAEKAEAEAKVTAEKEKDLEMFESLENKLK